MYKHKEMVIKTSKYTKYDTLIRSEIFESIKKKFKTLSLKSVLRKHNVVA